MKKHFLFIFAFILASSSIIWGQSIKKTKLLTGNGNETVEIENDKLSSFAKNYLQAIVKDDATTVFSYMNPHFKEKLGGEKKAIQFIEDELKKIPRPLSLTTTPLENGNLVREGDEPFNRMVININIADSNSEDNKSIDGFLIPIPYFENQKQGVYFLHTEGIITSLFPSNCNLSYQKSKPINEKPKGNKGSGSGSGVGSGSGMGSGKGEGSGVGNGNGLESQSNPTNNNSQQPPAPTNDGKTVGIQILSIPKPGYSFMGRLNNVQGSVILRVTFLANGQIGGVSPVRILPCGLTERAIEAARKIEFTPAIRNGKPYSINKSIQFNFTINGFRYYKFEDLLD